MSSWVSPDEFTEFLHVDLAARLIVPAVAEFSTYQQDLSCVAMRELVVLEIQWYRSGISSMQCFESDSFLMRQVSVCCILIS